MRHIALAVLLVGVGTLIRTLALDRLPPGLWSDEANHGLEANEILAGGPRPVFFPGNCGQEPLFKYLVAGITALRGPGVVTLRLAAGLAGALLLPLTWIWIRRSRGPVEALWGLFFLAFGVWHLHFSRIAFRAILGPTMGIGSLLLVDAYARRPVPWRGLLAGVVTALLWYTYPAFRLFPLLSGLWFALQTRGRHEGRRPWILPLLAFCVALLPLAWAWMKAPELMTARASMASLWSETPNVAAGFLRNLVSHLGMFTIAGDRNPRHNLSGAPQLDLVTGFLFVVGLAVALGRRDRVDVVLVAWLAVQLMPGVLSVERQAPHCLRALGVLPVPYLLAGNAVIKVRQWVGSRFAPALSFLIILAVLSLNLGRYFVAWPRSLRSLDQSQEALFGFHRPEAALGRWLASSPEAADIRVSPQLYLHWTVAYLAGVTRYGMCFGEEDLQPGARVVLQLHPRNVWWMRDDFRKNFFRWWTDSGRVSDDQIWQALAEGYPACPWTETVGDSTILRKITERYTLRALPDLDGLARFEIAARRPTPIPTRIEAAQWRRLPAGCFSVTVDSMPRDVQSLILVAREETSDRQWTLDSVPLTTDRPLTLRGCLLFPACARLEPGESLHGMVADWASAGPPDTEPYFRRSTWGRLRQAWARLRIRTGL